MKKSDKKAIIKSWEKMIVTIDGKEVLGIKNIVYHSTEDNTLNPQKNKHLNLKK